MKYVRTKNKIHVVLEENDYYYKCCYNDESTTLVSKSDNDAYGFPKVIQESDKLEYLVDEFIGILPNERPYFQFYRTIYNFDDIKAHYLTSLSAEPKTEYYGAIWTKGEDGEPLLKSVAKMNSEGELELL